MDFKISKLMDELGEKILKELGANARISYSELGRRVGLSTPAVTERVRKLEEAGIIEGYHAKVKRQEQGSLSAFIQLDAPAGAYGRIRDRADQLDQVLECHHVSGEGAFILKVRVGDVADLETLVAGFSPFGKTRTAIVLSSSKDESS